MSVTEQSIASIAHEDRGLVGGPFGSNLGRRDYVAHGIPVIRGSNMGGRYLDFADAVYVSEQKANGDLGGNKVRPGDIVITQRGTLGQVAVCPLNALDAVLSQSQMRLRVDIAKADALYVYYAMTEARFQHQILANAIRAGVPHINLRLLAGFTIPLPPLDVQRRIAGVLGNLDDLIDTNRRLAIQCEALALSIVEQVSPTTALDQIAVLATKAEKPEGLVDHYSIPAFDGNRLPSREEGVAIKSNKITLLEPAVLISRLNPATSRVWMAYPEPDAVSMCSTEFAVLQCANPEFVWAACSTTRFNEELVAMATGTTGSRQRVDKSEVMRLAVPNPRQTEKSVLDACTSLVKQAYACRLEAHRIGQARDELLPLLMSGRVVPGEVG